MVVCPSLDCEQVKRLFIRRMSERGRVRSVLALLVACISCERAASADSTFVVRDSAGIQIVENPIPKPAPVCSVATEPTMTIGETEGTDPYLLHRVTDALVLDGGNIVIGADGVYDVRMFGEDGKYLHSFGRRGEGPGEFRNIMRLFALGADTIVVEDYRPWRLSYFTADGEFLRAVVPQPLSVNRPDHAVLRRDGTIVSGHDCCRLREPGFHPQVLHLVLHDRDGVFVDTIGEYPFGAYGLLPDAGRDGSFISPLFESFTTVAGYGMNTIIGDQAKQELVILGENLEPSILLRWQVAGREGPLEVRRSDVEAYRERRIAAMTPANRQFVEEDVSPDRPVSERFPAFTGIVAANDGAIALRLYRRPADPEVDTYLLFDRDQRFVCTLKLSTRRRIWRLGTDHALLHEIGDMDVERLARYALIRPARAERP